MTRVLPLPARTVVPFISHIASRWAVPQNTSLLPSPLKSPVPATAQPAPNAQVLPLQARIVVPFISHIASCWPFFQQDVTLAIAVEVAGSRNRPAWLILHERCRCRPRPSCRSFPISRAVRPFCKKDVTVAIAVEVAGSCDRPVCSPMHKCCRCRPELSCRSFPISRSCWPFFSKTSLLPSPLKSPVPQSPSLFPMHQRCRCRPGPSCRSFPISRAAAHSAKARRTCVAIEVANDRTNNRI